MGSSEREVSDFGREPVGQALVCCGSITRSLQAWSCRPHESALPQLTRSDHILSPHCLTGLQRELHLARSQPRHLVSQPQAHLVSHRSV